jgi:AcrR family transcriptional regulator
MRIANVLMPNDARKEIVARSEKLFLRLGIRSVTVDDIARELGISKKTLYQHFENKDALVDAVIRSHLERERSNIQQICASASDAIDEIVKIGANLTATVEEVSASTLYDLQKYYRRSWELLISEQDHSMVNCILNNLARGIAEGLYRENLQKDIVAKIYNKASFMVVDEIAGAASIYSRRQLISVLHDYHIHAIATDKGLNLWNQYREENHYENNTQQSPD